MFSCEIQRCSLFGERISNSIMNKQCWKTMIIGEHKMKCSSWNQMWNALRGTKCEMLLVEPNVECSRWNFRYAPRRTPSRELQICSSANPESGTSDAPRGTKCRMFPWNIRWIAHSRTKCIMLPVEHQMLLRGTRCRTISILAHSWTFLILKEFLHMSIHLLSIYCSQIWHEYHIKTVRNHIGVSVYMSAMNIHKWQM